MKLMESPVRYHRPPFEDVLAAWKTLLAQRGFSTDLAWILDENLCFEKDPNAAAGVKLGFQTQLTPHPPDAAKATVFPRYEKARAAFRDGIARLSTM